MCVSVCVYRFGAETLPVKVLIPWNYRLFEMSNEWAMATPVLASTVIINSFVAGGTADDTANCKPKVWDNTPDEYKP